MNRNTNFLKEINARLKELNIEDVNDVIFIDKGKTIQVNSYEDLKDLYDFDYDASFGRVYITDFYIIIDECTWLERDSYDGAEGFILKAHPMLSKYINEESHY